MNKPSAYLETSFISYLTARTSRDLIVAGHQAITVEWWEYHRHSFDLFISPIVVDEASSGDPQAAAGRMVVLQLPEITTLEMTPSAYNLAQSLINRTSLPAEALPDAWHVAIACVNGLNYLLSWNCRHLANVRKRREIERVCADHNYVCPIICTPEELLGG